MTRSKPEQPEQPERRETLAQTIWRAKGYVLRAWLVFLFSAGALIQVLIWARPFTDTTLSQWIASIVAGALRLLGAEAQTDGTAIVSSLGTLQIIRECTGVYPTALFIAAVMAYPCSYARKAGGVLVGILGVQAINLVRVVSLFYVYKYFPTYFETAHLVVWQSLVVFLTLLMWLVWSSELAGGRVRHAA